jgi:hypothetical protein
MAAAAAGTDFAKVIAIALGKVEVPSDSLFSFAHVKVLNLMYRMIRRVLMLKAYVLSTHVGW